MFEAELARAPGWADLDRTPSGRLLRARAGRRGVFIGGHGSRRRRRHSRSRGRWCRSRGRGRGGRRRTRWRRCGPGAARLRAIDIRARRSPPCPWSISRWLRLDTGVGRRLAPGRISRVLSRRQRVLGGGVGRQADVVGQGLGLRRREQARQQRDRQHPGTHGHGHPGDVAPANSRASHAIYKPGGADRAPRRELSAQSPPL